MNEPDDRRRFLWGGTLQGGVQALVAASFLVAGTIGIYVPREVEQPAIGLALAGVAAALIGLGVVVDRRRRETPLPLVGPAWGRGLVLLLAFTFTACLVGLGAVGVLAVCFVLVAGVLVFVVLDRILGPAWILGCALVEQIARSRWVHREVVEAEGARALLREGTGTTTPVRIEQPLELGPAYLVLAPFDGPSEPYRSDESRTIVRAAETAAARRARGRTLVTACLALVSGLAWLLLPFLTELGRALSKPV